MKKEPKKPGQVNTEAASAETSREEYSLEEIMREFGGWSDWSGDKALWPEEADPVLPPTPPDPEPPASGEQEEPPPLPEEAGASVSAPDEDVRQMPESEPSAPEKRDFSGDTIRFTPIQEDIPLKSDREVWTYKGEPTPEQEKSKKASVRGESKRQRQAERLAKKQERRKRALARRQEQPEQVYNSPEAAYQDYCKSGSLRLRLAVSAALCLISAALLALCSYSIGGWSLSGAIRPVGIGLLVLMLMQAALAYDVCLKGLRAALWLRFDHLSLMVVLVLICTLDSVFAILEGRLPFCPVVSLELLLALWGESLHRTAKRRSMKAVCSIAQPSAAVREEKAWHGTDCIFRAEGDKDTFVRQIELPDATRRIMRIYAPIVVMVTLALAVFTGLRISGSFFWAWTAMLAAGFPAGVLFAYPRTFSTAARKLLRRGAAIAGWEGARNLSGECGIAIEDVDLFPPDNVTLNGMKIYSDRGVGQIVGYATAVVETAGSGLVPLFHEIQNNQNGRHYSVETFRRYEGGGLGAEIQGDIVLMGSLAFMKLMRVRMPEGTNLKQAVYLAINSELAAVFALHYTPDAAIQSALHAVARGGGLTPLLATRDFMITPQFLKHRYKLQPDRIEFPSVEERAFLSSKKAVKGPRQGAIMARGSFQCFSAVVAAGRSLRAAAQGAAAVSILGGILGILVLFFLSTLGAERAASAWNLLIFTLLWLLPSVLLTWQSGRG